MATATEVGPPRRPRDCGIVALAVLRTVVTVHGVAIFAQPVFAGRFLTGDYDMLGVHAFGADVVFYLGLVQFVAALLLWWRGGPRWPALGSLVLALGETGQYFAGLAGALDLHVPLGVALVAGATLLLVALWRPLRLAGSGGSR